VSDLRLAALFGLRLAIVQEAVEVDLLRNRIKEKLELKLPDIFPFIPPRSIFNLQVFKINHTSASLKPKQS